ncbi:MAG: hypothetical protein QOI62_1956 [Solirubrobacteraceae bacterium]|jgi:hypothetical protein|nr:hypothetical protein [Solirubrobacteraceae bacterium]MEA2358696.1 hypothetical protein [Solirubrobacteraceae bacterium]
MLLALLVFAAPAVALADGSPTGQGISIEPDDHGETHDGPELGAARFAATRTVAMRRGYAGRLSPGRAATLMARQIRAGGDQPALVTCSMRAPARATCTLTVIRGGVRWTGSGEVFQGRRNFRVSFEIATHD